jgi:hypothetical protein
MLKFLPIPDCPWSSISMDFIDRLPPSDGYNAILVIVCHLTKSALFIECKSTDDAPCFTKLYLKHVFSKHGVPQDIISDCGKLFISKFWASLCELLGVQSNLSTEPLSFLFREDVSKIVVFCRNKFGELF